jgi:hypothetical protein
LATADEVDCILMLGIGLGGSRKKALERGPLSDHKPLQEMVGRLLEEEKNAASALVECLDTYTKPILVVSDSATLSRQDRTGAVEVLEANGVYPYPNIRSAAVVMKRLIERREFLRKIS